MASTDEYFYELRIPKERVAVVIGKGGETKKKLESETKTKLNIDSEEGLVSISGDNALHVFSSREVIRAIGRGFNPEIAVLLLKQDYGLEMVNISDFAKNQKDIIRLRGRVIGEKGKSRTTIEELTETYICVFGKTVTILGEFQGLSTARRAVEQLLEGSPHSNVYRWLEKQHKEMKQRGMLEYVKG